MLYVSMRNRVLIKKMKENKRKEHGNTKKEKEKTTHVQGDFSKRGSNPYQYDLRPRMVI